MLRLSQNRWRLGLHPRPHWGAYSAPPDPSCFKGWAGKDARRKGRGKGGKTEGRAIGRKA